jgi:urease accessory protein
VPRIPSRLRIAPLAMLVGAATPAIAHPGHGEGLGLIGGLLHPFTGLDHMAAMLLVGAWAFRLPIERRWRAPAAFVAAMLAGFLTARMGVALPAEPVIALSLIGLPLLVAMAGRLPLAAQFAGVALFGAAHGFAHGAEIEGSATPFLAGMMIATLTLHALGFAGAAMLRRRQPARP